MANEVTTWNKVMAAAMKIPGVKVDRNSFLRSELRQHGCSDSTIENALTNNPAMAVDRSILDAIATACINSHTTKVTAASTAAGIPGGLWMFGTIPADLAQYYWHILVLAQKLAYVYGFPDFCDENGHLTDTASDMLTLLVGVMSGVAAANKAINEISKRMAEQMIKRLPRMALTKTVWYPIIKQVAKWLGVNITKSSFSKGLAKAIPILGGVISGALTYSTFRPACKRLQKKLQETSVNFRQQASMSRNEGAF